MEYVCVKQADMKKFWLASVAFLFTAASFAQGKGKVEFGAFIGPNWSTVSNDDYAGETHYSFNAGARMEYYFSDSWGLKVGLIYDRKGWDEDFIVVDGDAYLTDFKLDYLTIPVTANWHFGNDRAWYLHFGLYYGILLNAEDTAFGFDLKDEFKTSDFGLAYGIGYKFTLNDRLKLFLEFDGQAGIADISNYPDDLTTSRGSLNVGLNFLMN